MVHLLKSRCTVSKKSPDQVLFGWYTFEVYRARRIGLSCNFGARIDALEVDWAA